MLLLCPSTAGLSELALPLLVLCAGALGPSARASRFSWLGLCPSLGGALSWGCGTGGPEASPALGWRQSLQQGWPQICSPRWWSGVPAPRQRLHLRGSETQPVLMLGPSPQGAEGCCNQGMQTPCFTAGGWGGAPAAASLRESQ